MPTDSKQSSAWGLILKLLMITIFLPVLVSLLTRWVAGL